MPFKVERGQLPASVAPGEDLYEVSQAKHLCRLKAAGDVQDWNGSH